MKSFFNYWENLEVGEFVKLKGKGLSDIPDFMERVPLHHKGKCCKVVSVDDEWIEDKRTNKTYFCKRVGVEDICGNISHFYNDKKLCFKTMYIGTWFKRKSYLLSMVSMLYYIVGR